MRTAISMAVVIAGLSAVSVTSVLAEHHDATQNAALQYWQALVDIPAHPRHTVWEVASSSPLTATLRDAEFLLGEPGVSAVALPCLEDLRRGARMPYCEWALPCQDGPYVRLRHTQRAPTAIGLLLLSSRLNHSKGHVKDAISDLTAAWAFTRHLASDETLVTWGNHLHYVDKRIAPLASCWVPQLEESAARQLQQDLEQLPAPMPFAVVLRKDRQRLLDFLTRFAKQKDIESIRDEMTRLASADEDREAMRNVETAEEALEWIAEASQMLDRAVVIATFPLGRFEPAAARFQSEVSAGNPLARSLFGLFWREPKLLAARFWEAESTTRLAMFEAVIALRISGHDAFTAVRDPFGNGPFESRPTEGGYTLTSSLVIDDEPFVMTFGRNALPKAKEKSQLLVYDAGADSASEIEKALSKARREKKRVLLQWGFNGCAPCYRLHRMFEDNDRLAAILQERYVRLAVDVTNDENDVLAEEHGVEFPGVPQLTVLDIDGSAVVNIRASDELCVHRELDAGLVRKFLEKWAPSEAEPGKQ